MLTKIGIKKQLILRRKRASIKTINFCWSICPKYRFKRFRNQTNLSLSFFLFSSSI